MQNKKSQLEDLLPLLLLIVLGIFSILIFISCTAVREDRMKEEVEFQSLSKDSTQLLINFLKSPFALNDYENSNIADAINHYFLTKDKILSEQINTKANEFFSKSDLETDYSSWSLDIKYPKKKMITIEPEKSRKKMIQRKVISEVIIPTYGFDKFVEIRLFFVQTKFTAK